MPKYIVDDSKWEFMCSHPIKANDGWFAKTIGRTFVFKRRVFSEYLFGDSEGNMKVKTQVDPASGLNLIFATDNPRYAPGIGVDVNGNPIVCIDTALPARTKRKYVKNKLHKRKKHTRKRKD
jgi:hypothetical protein